MKQLLLATAAAAATLLPTASLANTCQLVAQYYNPIPFACQSTGRMDFAGRTIYLCCQ